MDLSPRIPFLPQIFATLVTSSFSVCYGITLAQTAVIIAQLTGVHNFTGTDSISITDNDAFWITSIGAPSMLATTILTSFIIDTFGRLNTLRLMTVPFILGQILIASSTNLKMLIVGNAISTGISMSFIIASTVYVTEISSPEIRGTLLCQVSVAISLGVLLTFVKGKYLTWRTLAYVVNGYVIVFFILTMFIPESTFWLVLKHRTEQAKKSAEWFGSPQPVVASSDRPKTDFQAFMKPTFYKPLILVTGFFLFQELSGSYVVNVNLITFFNDFGTKTDPYTLSIYAGTAEVLIGICNTWSMTKFQRRSLAIFSFLGMAFCISLSATFTALVYNGNISLYWIPPLMLVFYIFFLNIGVIFLPYLVSAELWPANIRGTALSISHVISQLISLLAVKVYYLMKNNDWPSWNVQYFYGVMALAGSVYVYTFLPETHKKCLTEVENYF